MAVLLVAFMAQGAPLSNTYHSQVKQVASEPTTAQAVVDFAASLAMEYGISGANMLAWQTLDVPAIALDVYCYFATAAATHKNRVDIVSATVIRQRPILTTDDLRSVEEDLRADLQALRVNYITCRLVTDPLPEWVARLDERARLKNA